MNDHDAREALRATLAKVFDFLDVAAGEGLCLTAVGPGEMDAAEIMVEVANATGANLDQSSEALIPEIVSALLASLPAPTPAAGEAVSEADIFQAIHEAAQDEREGKPDGDIIVKGCEAAGYCDPESAADSFKAMATQKVAALLAKAAPQPPTPGGEGDASLASAVGYAGAVLAAHADKMPVPEHAKSLAVRCQEASLILAALPNHSPDAGGVGEDGLTCEACGKPCSEDRLHIDGNGFMACEAAFSDDGEGDCPNDICTPSDSSPVVDGVNLETVIAASIASGNDVQPYEIAMAVRAALRPGLRAGEES